MGLYNNDPTEMLIKSAPIPVYWHGWQSDTLNLQRCGWQFAAHIEPSSFMTRIVMRNPDLALSALFDEFHFPREAMQVGNTSNLPPLIVSCVRANMELRQIETTMKFEEMHMLDMETSMISRQEVRRLEDLLPFNIRAPNPEVTKDIVLENNADMEVVDYLQAILDKQEDKQAEMRQARLSGEMIDNSQQAKIKQVKFQVVA